VVAAGNRRPKLVCSGTKTFLTKIKNPLQAWTGPEVSRRLRLTDFKTIGT
jgi:hypothetical protein